MRQLFTTALRVTLLTWVLTGVVYPALVTVLAQTLLPQQAHGSLVRDSQGHEVGSALIGQSMQHPAYFQPRPSAAGTGYDAVQSTGSNLGPTSQALQKRATATLEQLRRDNPAAPGPVPVALLTASGSGLDPDISPEAALWQAPRVATARGVQVQRVRTLVQAHVQGRTLGFLGEPRVNVLLLNLALDQQFGAPSRVGAATLMSHALRTVED